MRQSNSESHKVGFDHNGSYLDDTHAAVVNVQKTENLLIILRQCSFIVLTTVYKT